MSPRGNRGGVISAGPGEESSSYSLRLKTKVTCLVRGHYGSVLALGIFPDRQEYATAGHDRSD